MGFTTQDYLLEDYRSLHQAWLEAQGQPPGDMIFTDRADS